MPLWRTGGARFGRMRVTYRILFSKDDLDKISIEEINDAIIARLSGAEGTAPTKKPFETHWSRNLAKGLHNLLYFCPFCRREYTTVTERSTIRCTACGISATINRQGELVTDRGISISISSWFLKQEQHVMQSLAEDMKPIVHKVILKLPSPKSGGGMEDRGHGTMRIDPGGWRFDGEIDGKPSSLFFPVDTTPAISFDHNSNYQIFHGGNYYQFVPEETHRCLEYTIIAECLHRKFATKPLLT
jgi:hypothetical protein